MIEPPIDPKKKELLAAILRGGTGAIPFVGGLLGEVGDLYFNPLEKRKEKWFIEVTSAINEIERCFAILPKQLESDERFISFLYQITGIAMKNHQKEKIQLLRNAVVSSASPERSAEDVAFQFLRFVDELTVSHMQILTCFKNHFDEFVDLVSMEKVYDKFTTLSSLEIGRIQFRAFLHDLDARFLIRIGDLEELPEFASKIVHILSESSEYRLLEMTELADDFLTFVRE